MTYAETKDISGINPYLLSHLGVNDDYGEYKGTVAATIDNFLKSNLGELKTIPVHLQNI